MSEAKRAAELQELLREVRRIRVQSSRLVQGALAGSYRSVFRGTGIEFEEVREYVEGDDPRSVDWNVTARMGRPFIKKYVDERQRNLAFLLDLSPRLDATFSAWSPRQMAARIGACLMLAAAEHDDRVSFLGYDRQVRRFEPPRKGMGHVMRIIRDMLELPAGVQESRPAAALEYATKHLPWHSTVFLLSDFLNDGWQPALQDCARKHEVVAVRLLSPELERLPEGLWRLRHAERGGRRLVDGNDAQVQQEYQQRVARWDAECKHMLQRAGVARMDVPLPKTADPDAVARPILRFFQRHGGRGPR